VALLELHPRLDLAVVVDEWNRPIELVERHPLAGIRSIENPMKVQLLSRPSQVLHRALTRAASSRFDPLAVINGQGALLGTVRVERLMRAVLKSLNPTEPGR